jgi:hypothetical protein
MKLSQKIIDFLYLWRFGLILTGVIVSINVFIIIPLGAVIKFGEPRLPDNEYQWTMLKLLFFGSLWFAIILTLWTKFTKKR